VYYCHSYDNYLSAHVF
nr:immunoglobulin light chain junction region [Macaca mulatta]